MLSRYAGKSGLKQWETFEEKTAWWLTLCKKRTQTRITSKQRNEQQTSHTGLALSPATMYPSYFLVWK